MHHSSEPQHQYQLQHQHEQHQKSQLKQQLHQQGHQPYQQQQKQHQHQPGLIPSPNGSTATKKKSRLSYSINFKLAAVRHAESHGNRATARYLGINEKQIRDWRSKKSSLMNTNVNAKRLKGAGRQCSDSNKRLNKGASSGGHQTSLNNNNSNSNKKIHSASFMPIINHHLHHHAQQQSGYDFSWWSQCLPHSESTIMKEETRDDSFSSSSPSPPSLSPSNNNNNNYVTHSIRSIIEKTNVGTQRPNSRDTLYSVQPHLHFSSDNDEPTYRTICRSDDEGEQELKEKISCALALLELKKTSKKLGSFGQYHQQSVITW